MNERNALFRMHPLIILFSYVK